MAAALGHDDELASSLEETHVARGGDEDEPRTRRGPPCAAPRDLAEWRLISGRPSGKGLIIPPMDGDEWKRHDWQNWRRRVYQPAAIAAGVTGDLRPTAR